MTAKDVERILLITWNYPPKVGGMEQLLYQLVQQIRSETKVDIIAPHSSDEVKSTDNINLYRPRIRSLIWFFFFALRQGVTLSIKQGYKVIFGGSVLVSPVVYLVGKITNKPTMLYAHGLDLIYQNTLYQWVIKFVLPRTDLVLTNSTPTKKIALGKGVELENVSVINPGIFSAEYQTGKAISEVKRKYNLQDHKVLLYVGRLARRKGVHNFVKYSLPEIVNEHQDVMFCVVGGDPEESLLHKGNMREVIEKEAENQGMLDHIKLFGWVERSVLLDMFALCDVFVLPAIQVPGDMEGFGIVLAEANAAGKPVVSSRIGGIPDAVVDGKSAILIEPGEWNAYTQAIIELLDDKKYRDELGRHGMDYVRKELDWKVIGKKFLGELNKI